MKVRVAVGVGVLVVVVVGAVAAFGLTRAAPKPVAAPVVPSSVTTLAPTPLRGPTPTPTASPSAPPAVTTGDSSDDQPFAGLGQTLTAAEDATSSAFAIEVATALTRQIPGEDRRARLAAYFTSGSSGRAQAGPAADDSATVNPKAVNSTDAFNPGDPGALGILVSLRYDISEPGTDGLPTFGPGDVKWKLTLVRSGGSWLASAVRLEASTNT